MRKTLRINNQPINYGSEFSYWNDLSGCVSYEVHKFEFPPKSLSLSHILVNKFYMFYMICFLAYINRIYSMQPYIATADYLHC